MDSIFILFCFRCNQHNNDTRVHQEVYFMSAPHTSRRFLSGKVVFYPFHDPVSSLTKKEVFSFMSIPQTSVRLRVMLENVPPFSLQSYTKRQTGFCWKWAGKVRKKYQSMQRELLAHIFKKHPTFFPNPNVQNLTPFSSPPATVSASAVLPHYISISITSYCSITSPPAPKVPSSQKHTGIPISASCFIPTAASLQPPAKLNGLYWRQGSRVCSIQLSSAGLQAL